MTYDEWFALYLSLYKRRIKPKTREGYMRLHQLLSPLIGGVELAAIAPDLAQAALVAVEEQTGSRQAQLAYTLLRAAFSRAVKSGHMQRNPLDLIDKPHHQSQRGRAIKGSDWERLLPLIAAEPAFALAAFAGLRRGELLALRREDIDLIQGRIYVRRQLVRVAGQMVEQTPKSAAGCRIVPIVPELLPILAAACRLLHPRTRLIAAAPETVNHRWRQIQLEAGIEQPYRLHDLRHTCATRLITRGLDLAVAQYILGHSSYKLTIDTYTHIDADDAAKAVASLERRF